MKLYFEINLPYADHIYNSVIVYFAVGVTEPTDSAQGKVRRSNSLTPPFAVTPNNELWTSQVGYKFVFYTVETLLSVRYRDCGRDRLKNSRFLENSPYNLYCWKLSISAYMHVF